MSKYRVQLRWLVEQWLADKGAANIEANWPLAYEQLGLADYPIFDEAYRPTLNDKIIRHYYMYEIGAETPGLFRLFVRDTMHLIMPYYNQMYESLGVAAKILPLVDHTRPICNRPRQALPGSRFRSSGANRCRRKGTGL